MLLLTVYWKADLALFRRPDLEKDKNKEQIWPGAVRLKIIILRAVIQSWNFADFDLYICGETGKLRNLGFRQCKTIIMPLIPISCPSVSCCRRCLRCAKRCSFCSAVSRWRLLLRCSRWIWSRRSRSRGVSVETIFLRASFGRQDYKVTTLGNIYLPTILSIVLVLILSLASYVNLNSNLRSRYNILL